MTTCDVEEVVNVSLDEIVDRTEVGGRDGFLDLLAEKSGHDMLMGIGYEPVGVNEDKTVRVKVTGCVEVMDEDKTPEQRKGEAYL